jgi:hypothetical protein
MLSPWLDAHEQLAERIRKHVLYPTLFRRVADIEATHVYGRYGRRGRHYTLNGALYFSALHVPSSRHTQDTRRARRRADHTAKQMLADVFDVAWPGGDREMIGALFHVARRDVEQRRIGVPS